MRTGAPATARSAYYDRNPLTIQLAVSQLLGPHSWTQHVVYTVPANRKATIEYCELSLERWPLQVTTLQQVWFAFEIQTVGGGWAIVSHVVLWTQSPTQRSVEHSQGGTLNAGDTAAMYSFDNCTGGQCYYTGYVKLLEFDA